MVVSFIAGTSNARALQSLLFREGSENTKDDRHASGELYLHERLRDAFADVLEVHSFAFDENTDRDHRVERSVLCARRARDKRCAAARDGRGRAWRAEVLRTQQIYGCCTCLDMGSGDHSTRMIISGQDSSGWGERMRTAGRTGEARSCLGPTGR
jgi:hypothetical protein